MKKIIGLLVALLATTANSFASQEKLIALTFDDGPRPYVLFGTPPGAEKPTPSLLDLLDKDQVKATFFVMGWRLTPGSYGDRREPRIDKTCLDAARETFRRGNEIENHTYSHVQLRLLEKQKGETGAVADVDKGAQMVKSVTGRTPLYLRPPDWIMTPELARDLQARGYHILTISSELPIALRDVNSLDYLCAGRASQCPKPSLTDSVLRQIADREKHGVTTHILTFHELSTTYPAIEKLIPELKSHGYRFVTLEEYMRLVRPAANLSATSGQ
ncbi:MAG TPA: polysaccharide deacetylase family protein [Terriglobales bacterium]|nr:polysaccharide deacetylase family protein [Terriglobales bacterium]